VLWTLSRDWRTKNWRTKNWRTKNWRTKNWRTKNWRTKNCWAQELLTDHDLLAGGVADAWAINLAHARRWARMVEFHGRREAGFAAHDREEQRLLLTARQ